MDFQRTLCSRDLFIRTLLYTALVGHTLTTGGNHIESPTNLETTSATLYRRPLPQPRGLQQNLPRQDAKSLNTRNQVTDARGRPTGNMDTRWPPPCIITDAKMYTSPPRPMSASWTLSSSFHTIIKCHSYRQLTD
jgi:hypothetical protein